MDGGIGSSSDRGSVLGSDSAMSYAAYHFSTSGAAVAAATAITHPLGVISKFPLVRQPSVQNDHPFSCNLDFENILRMVEFQKHLNNRGTQWLCELGRNMQDRVCDADVVKVRLQMQLAGQRGRLVGMAEIFADMIKVEGPRALYLGLAPALTRSVLYGGLRLGLYEPCKYICDYMFGSTNFIMKIASGATSGALATALTNPLEVLKVRLQSKSNSRNSPIREMHKIVSEEGIKALWKGVGPAMTRAACLTASQMATYDESKQALLKWTPLEEGFRLHLISSCISGTTGTLVTAPVDMIKTRLMLQRESRAVRTYKNGFHCAYQVVLTEGVKSLYKGGFATFARLGPQTIITFVVCEKLRELAGMKAI